MAKLSARRRHELARFEYASKRITRMSDGNLLVNHGQGWSVYGKLKAGIDPLESARAAQQRYDARSAEFHNYIKALKDAVSLEHRGQFHQAIVLMPEDADGVWSTMEDWLFNDGPDLDDCVKACRCYLALLALYPVNAPGTEVTA